MSFKHITLKQLYTFQLAACEPSLARAAEKLHLTPPAVTIQIKELEKRLGLPLFYKRGRKLVITTEGQYLLDRVRTIQRAIDDAAQAIDTIKNLDTARIRLGMVSPAKYFLPSLLTLFRNDYPGVEIKLIENNRKILTEQLRDNKVDFAVMGRSTHALDTHEIAFAQQPHVFIAAPQHPLAQKKPIPLSGLQGWPLLMREQGSGTRAHCEALLAQADITPKIVLESSSNETIKQAVIANMGISFLSMNTLGHELDHRLIAVLPVSGTPITSTWYIVSLAGTTPSPAVEALQQFIVKQGHAFLQRRFQSYL